MYPIGSTELVSERISRAIRKIDRIKEILLASAKLFHSLWDLGNYYFVSQNAPSRFVPRRKFRSVNFFYVKFHFAHCVVDDQNQSVEVFFLFFLLFIDIAIIKINTRRIKKIQYRKCTCVFVCDRCYLRHDACQLQIRCRRELFITLMHLVHRATSRDRVSNNNLRSRFVGNKNHALLHVQSYNCFTWKSQ